MDKWLEISKEDLEASKILYRNKKYPQASFYFQQSIEKLFKALLLESKTSNNNELKKYSHLLLLH